MEIATLDYFIDDKSVLNTELIGDVTVLDSDIVICDPPNLIRKWEGHLMSEANENYLSANYSIGWIKSVAERRAELSTLLENGKLIICFLNPLTEILAQKRYRGDYESITNYDFLPLEDYTYVDLITKGEGGNNSNLRLIGANNPFAQFFHAFKMDMRYHAYFDCDASKKPNYFIQNKSKRGVALLLKVLNGHIVFLPRIPYEYQNLKLLGVIHSCSMKLLNTEVITPRPKWIDKFKLRGEDDFIYEKESLEKKIQKLEIEKSIVDEKMTKLSQYKKLLFEQGGELEDVVIESFKLMGFNADGRKKGDIEHDIVFDSKEGRGLAEVEGKDRSAVSISKLDQLNRAVDEDFHLNGKYPQGVLIGNHYRLTEPESRKEPFTNKVHIVAGKKSLGLLTTIEIYKAVEYILDNPKDEDFKKECRVKILSTEGDMIRLI
ncbi:hypothetical protein F8C76_04435 [Flagellimonas olearia]|uniref:Uncharacterized protein n=1 Tax=Flagellimonas olearia TaxID=552546 RepID=A0A6I1EAH6_9FLAO|nr:hypothetical protein [Allomuricauda olearia]KAB7530754.1 hypothetical protein F8C76_04435 [Allomuricauda olearia]